MHGNENDSHVVFVRMSAVLPLDAYSAPHACQALSDLAKGQSARVVGVVASGGDVPADLTRRLADLGFLPGERVQVLARGPLGGEPVAVRVGTATFALRRLEADCIRIAPLE
jgi:ferrous iron transport protein A